MFNLDPLELALRIPVLLLALTVHEFAHAYSAYRLGDPTAFRLGRCTLNPLAHLEPVGALCLLFAPIGWAKPVPINPINLNNPGRDDIIISAAGPVSNLLQATAYALLLRLLLSLDASHASHGWQAAANMVFMGVQINVGLAVFNLIPLYPLDGFHVFSNLAKGETRQRMLEMANAGPAIIGALVFSGMLGFDLLCRMMRPVQLFFLERVAGLGS